MASVQISNMSKTLEKVDFKSLIEFWGSLSPTSCTCDINEQTKIGSQPWVLINFLLPLGKNCADAEIFLKDK